MLNIPRTNIEKKSNIAPDNSAPNYLFIEEDEFIEFSTICALIAAGYTTKKAILKKGCKLLGRHRRERLSTVLWRYADGPIDLWSSGDEKRYQLVVKSCAV